jgi:hypothetical protein
MGQFSIEKPAFPGLPLSGNQQRVDRNRAETLVVQTGQARNGPLASHTASFGANALFTVHRSSIDAIGQPSVNVDIISASGESCSLHLDHLDEFPESPLDVAARMSRFEDCVRHLFVKECALETSSGRWSRMSKTSAALGGPRTSFSGD